MRDLPAFLPERSIRFSPTGSAPTISPDRRGIFLPARCVGLAFEQDTGAESSLEYCDQPIPRRAFAPVFKLLISRIQIFLKKSGTCRPVRRHTLCKQRACPLFSLSGKNRSGSPKAGSVAPAVFPLLPGLLFIACRNCCVAHEPTDTHPARIDFFPIGLKLLEPPAVSFV